VKLHVMLIALVVFAAPLAGCLKKDPVQTADLEQEKAEQLLGDSGRQSLADAAAIIPKNYSFPQQQLLPQQIVEIVGTITSAANGALEIEQDQGGIERNTYYDWHDISSLVPPGQPVELVIDVWWDASEFNSADLDIAVDVPGTQTSYSAISETFNWNLPSKTMVVNTVGVSGLPAKVGVQAGGGIITQGFDYTLRIRATYVKDVLTPHHAWAIEVPAGASGIIIESEKASGEEHVTSQFVIIDPEDNLVQFVDFNDIDIPTESVFIPTTKPGTYVFYAYFMHGGFFRVKADVPLDVTAARTLPLVETRVVDSNAPAPGIAGKDFFNGSAAEGIMPKSDVSPTVVDFTTSGAFPLRVTGFITGTVQSQAKITLSSSLGVVHTLTKIARVEDDAGSIGWTSDHENGPNNVFTWRNIQRGGWKAEIVNTSPGVEIGHIVLSYTR